MSSAIHLCLECHILTERGWIETRGKCYGRSCLVDRLEYRRTVTLEIAVPAVDRLDRMAPADQGSGTHLRAVSRQCDVPQGSRPVVKCQTACGYMACVTDMTGECDILPEGRRVQTRL